MTRRVLALAAALVFGAPLSSACEDESRTYRPPSSMSSSQTEPASALPIPAPGQKAASPKPVTTGTLHALSRPETTVFSGGEPIGRTPLKLKLAPGYYDLALTAPRHHTRNVGVSIQPGRTTSIDVTLDPREPHDQAKGEGTFTLKTTPWAKVSIDGQPYGSTPLFKTKLSGGRHEVHLVNEQQGVDLKRKIHIIAGQNLKRAWKLPSTPAKKRRR